MIKAILYLVIAVQVSSWSLITNAMRYQATMHNAEWRLQSSPFECRLWQPVPDFGDAVFARRAGEEQMFYLAPVLNAMAAGEASLVIKAPPWGADRGSVDMGVVNVNESDRPITLGKKHAIQLLNELFRGMSPEFTRQSFYQSNEEIQLGLSSINFRRAFDQYKECLAQLLPVNFDQIKRSRIQFQLSKDELTPSSKARLEQVVQYVKADSSVNSFYIDGHTDDLGRRLSNLELSQKRAQKVTDYLIAHGVDEALITTRYHGERYPVVKNNSPSNRAMNRRVTIRLERENL
jgi:outer membrane protein OmpA-like peptidoglycan-associated protein